MAAGIGSRFGGGIKQLEPVDNNNHIIMDYSIHDAIEAGFNHVVFIIRRDIEEEFKEVIGFVIVHTIRMIKDGMSFVRERNVRLLLVVQRGWNIQGEMLMENGQMRNGKNGRLII